MPELPNALVAQSGGPTAVINNSLSGVIEAWFSSSPGKLFGALYGINGVLQEKFINLSGKNTADIDKLRKTPAAALGSSRYKIADQEDYKILVDVFKRNNIRYFFYIGGNDSMDTANKINNLAADYDYEMYVIGIPNPDKPVP